MAPDADIGNDAMTVGQLPDLPTILHTALSLPPWCWAGTVVRKPPMSRRASEYPTRLWCSMFVDKPGIRGMLHLGEGIMGVRVRFPGAALAFGLCPLLACGGPGGAPLLGNPDSGSGGTTTTGACDAYFDALYTTNCGGIVPPAAELARIKVRFETLCLSVMTLPGSNYTADAIAVCASAQNTLGCGQLDLTPGPCSLPAGSLGGGATCQTGAQCQSNNCSADTTCGTCAPVTTGSAAGQPCSGGCAAGTACSTAKQLCTPVTYGSAGAACDGTDARCNAGLVCNLALGKCAAPGGVGTACLNSFDCVADLTCPGPMLGSTCRSPGQAGATCMKPSDCAVGLTCGSTNKCAQVTWASAGQPCSDTILCPVGDCPTASNGVVGGTCPTVIADGQPCVSQTSSATCDTFAQCFDGVCHLGLGGLCP